MQNHSPAARTLSGRQIQIVSAIIALSFVFSGLIGLVRSAIVGAIFGAGSQLDAFYAAYRLPEMLFTLVAGGALGSAFIPVYSRLLGKEDVEGAWQLARAVLTLVVLAATVLAALASLLSHWIAAHVLLPEAAAAQQRLTADLMRIMLWTVVIFSVSGLVMGILNANQHFLTPALAPSMNNVGLILGALLLSGASGIHGLAYGALLGALLHLAVQLPALRARGFLARLRPVNIGAAWRTSGLREVLILMGPRLIGQAAVQINFVVNIALASGMAEGSLTALTYAFSLMFVILGVIGQSIGTAIFPTLSVLGAKEDYDGFRRTLTGAVRGALFIALPAMVGLLLLAVPLVAVIYERGRWTTEDTVATSWALLFFAFGLPAFVLQEVLARAFYALRDTLTPVMVAVAGMVLNVALSLLLIRVVQGRQFVFGAALDPMSALTLWRPPAGQGPFGGLALANAIATSVESAVLWLLLRRRLGYLEDGAVAGMALRALLAAVLMGAAVWVSMNAELPHLPTLVIGGVVGATVYEGAALLLGLPEARSIPAAVLGNRLRMFRAKGQKSP